MKKLAVVVDEDDDGIMSIGIRKLGDKVDSNVLPRRSRHFLWRERGLWMGSGFVSLAGVAS